MSDLKPWEGPEEAPPLDESKGGYLFGAGILAGLTIAIGCGAILGHFAQRPDLAAADPLMQTGLVWGRWGGWILAAASAVGLFRATR